MFFRARNVKRAEIYHQISKVYRENEMSDGMVIKWILMKCTKMFMMRKGVSGHLSLIMLLAVYKQKTS